MAGLWGIICIGLLVLVMMSAKAPFSKRFQFSFVKPADRLFLNTENRDRIKVMF